MGMKTFFIDTTNNYLNIALLKNANFIDFVSIKAKNNLTKITNFEIEKIFKKNKINYFDIDEVLLVVGPGSFTGVKIGVSIVKAWNLVNEFKVIKTISILDLLGNNSYVDARSNRSFVKKNNRIEIIDNKLLKLDKMISIHDFKKEMIILALNKFKKTNINELKPLYAKEIV